MDCATYTTPDMLQITELWRLQDRRGLQIRTVLVPTVASAGLVWYVGERVSGSRDFPNRELAIARAEQMRQGLLAAGRFE